MNIDDVCSARSLYYLTFSRLILIFPFLKKEEKYMKYSTLVMGNAECVSVDIKKQKII